MHSDLTDTFEVELTRKAGYQFDAAFGDASDTTLLMDEPEPLGEGRGPNAARVVAAAVGNCLSASLLFCFNKARIEVGEVKTRIRGSIVRNEQGRMRLGSLEVRIVPDLGSVPTHKIQRCLDIYEDFCLVTASVRAGLDVTVDVDVPEEAVVEEVS